MHKDKKMGMFIIKIGAPESQDKSEKKEDMYEEIKKERSEKVKDNKKEYSLADYGGYSPDDLVKKLEDIHLLAEIIYNYFFYKSTDVLDQAI